MWIPPPYLFLNYLLFLVPFRIYSNFCFFFDFFSLFSSCVLVRRRFPPLLLSGYNFVLSVLLNGCNSLGSSSACWMLGHVRKLDKWLQEGRCLWLGRGLDFTPSHLSSVPVSSLKCTRPDSGSLFITSFVFFFHSFLFHAPQSLSPPFFTTPRLRPQLCFAFLNLSQYLFLAL